MYQKFLLNPPTVLTVLGLRQASLIDGNILGAHYVQSVSVDNPTGFWLLIENDGTFIRPYTIGFVHNLDFAANNVTISFQSAGPAGQLSSVFAATGKDAKVTIILNEQPGATSGGADFSQYVTNLDQPETAVVSLGGNVAAVNTPSVVTSSLLGGLNRRLRIYDLITMFDFSVVGPGTRIVGEFQAQFSAASGGSIIGFMNINSNHQSEYRVLSPPVTLPVGSEIRCDIYGMSPSVGAFAAQVITALAVYGIL